MQRGGCRSPVIFRKNMVQLFKRDIVGLNLVDFMLMFIMLGSLTILLAIFVGSDDRFILDLNIPTKINNKLIASMINNRAKSHKSRPDINHNSTSRGFINPKIPAYNMYYIAKQKFTIHSYHRCHNIVTSAINHTILTL